MHGRTVRGEFALDGGTNKIPGVVKIGIGVNAYGDVTTMEVLSGDKALQKDAKSYLVKCKFLKALGQNRDPMSGWTNRDNPDYPIPYHGDLPHFQVYDVIFSTPAAKTKP